jgi:putative lipoprotein
MPTLRKFGVVGVLAAALALVSLTLSGCAGSRNATAVSGTVTYLVRMALPPDATVIVKIEDISLADAASTVMGEQEIKTDGKQVPIPYSVTYDTDEIVDNHSYSITARILDGTGKLMFISDTVVPVITRGNPTENVEVMVVPIN